MIVTYIDPEESYVWARAKPKASIKGLRRALQLQFHAQGIFGLEFWFIRETNGLYKFEVLSPHGNDFKYSKLLEFNK